MVKLSAKEILETLDNQWANTNDVRDIGSIGQNKALQIMRQIRKKAEYEGYFLPKNLVPMEMVIDHFKINVSYLKRVSTKEVIK